MVKDLKEIEKGERIYSRQYGIGTIASLYEDDEIIVQFSNLRKRLSVQDGISKIPEKYLQKQRNAKVEVIFEGKSISFAEFKKRSRAEKKHIKLRKSC